VRGEGAGPVGGQTSHHTLCTAVASICLLLHGHLLHHSCFQSHRRCADTAQALTSSCLPRYCSTTERNLSMPHSLIRYLRRACGEGRTNSKGISAAEKGLQDARGAVDIVAGAACQEREGRQKDPLADQAHLQHIHPMDVQPRQKPHLLAVVAAAVVALHRHHSLDCRRGKVGWGG